jgi:exopolysaccharide biosynthesis polyprenyl glycosylphosphotransferase
MSSIHRRRKDVVLPLVRTLCSSAVRVADLISLSAALCFTLFSPSLERGQSLSGFLALSISVRTLAIELALLLGWRAVFWATGMYQPRLNRSASAFLWRVPLTVAICAASIGPLLYLEHEPFAAAFRAAFVFWFTGTTLMFTTRAGYYTYDEYLRPALRPRRNILVIGTGPRASVMTRALAAHPDFRYQLAGFVDTDPQPQCEGMATMLGGVANLETILMRQPIDEVLIALPIKSRFAEIQQVVAICGRAGVQTQYSLDLFTTEVAKHHVTDESTGVRVVEMVHNDQRLLLKGAIDRLTAAVGLFFLSPLLLVIAAVVKLTSKGPVFFVQERWGKNKRTFGMIKFRSMVVDAEARQAELEKFNEFGGPMFKMRSDPRVTRVGNFLRRSSLDELPQLLNVLLGDMSLVGPRPLPKRDVELFSEPWLMRRFSVKPGITGLWQVSGRSNMDFDQTIQLDLRYIDRWSLLLDAKILLRTFGAVLKGRGAF